MHNHIITTGSSPYLQVSGFRVSGVWVRAPGASRQELAACQWEKALGACAGQAANRVGVGSTSLGSSLEAGGLTTAP